MSAQSSASAFTIRHETRATFRLAAPLVLAQLAQMGMGVTDTVMLGGLGREALAAGGLGAGIFFTLATVLQGLVFSLGILVSHARGASAEEKIAPLLKAGLVLASLTALPLMLLLWNVEHFLIALGEDAMLAHNVARYVQILLFAAPAFMWLGAQRSYLTAMGHPRVVLVVALVALVVNATLNYGLMHGRFGLPDMGYLGSCTATLIALWGSALATGLAIRTGKPPGDNAPVRWSVMGELLALGWPIAITMGVEMILFLVGGLMMSLLGTTALAAHQVTLNVASVTFMIPLGVAQAANARVGLHMGANDPRGARRAATAAFMLGVGFMAFSAATLLIIPRAIAQLFNLDPAKAGDADVIGVVVKLLAICAFFQIFDGAQTIAAGALRGLKDTRIPAVLAGLSYWAVGFPVAWLLAFPMGWGATGVWWGLALSLLVAAIVLNARFWRLSAHHIARVR